MKCKGCEYRAQCPLLNEPKDLKESFCIIEAKKRRKQGEYLSVFDVIQQDPNETYGSYVRRLCHASLLESKVALIISTEFSKEVKKRAEEFKRKADQILKAREAAAQAEPVVQRSSYETKYFTYDELCMVAFDESPFQEDVVSEFDARRALIKARNKQELQRRMNRKRGRDMTQYEYTKYTEYGDIVVRMPFD